MKIIIPMAGRGTRLRPHTLTVPKPLIPIAGKPIIQRLVEDLATSYNGKVDEIAYIVGDFGADVERDLIEIAAKLGAKGTIYRQDKAAGVGHAIYCAKESLDGPCMVAFADTLFKADFTFDSAQDGVIWVQKVKDPSAYGVVKLNDDGYITDFVEKPSTFVSDMAIVGIYYFRQGEKLRDALKHIITENIREKGEYQLTTALELLKNQGTQFYTGEVEEWLDCGNKEAIIHSNARMLDIHQDEKLVADNVTIENSVVIHPCYLGEGVTIRNSVVGPYVSVGSGSTIDNVLITNSIIQENSLLKNGVLEHCMVGSGSKYVGTRSELNLGDYSQLVRR